MTTELKWPERARCRSCRKYFAAEVIDLLYCSYPCAGLPRPVLSEAPRTCRFFRPGVEGRVWKARYRREVDVPERQRNEPSVSVYYCDYCHHWHVGHDRQQEQVSA